MEMAAKLWGKTQMLAALVRIAKEDLQASGAQKAPVTLLAPGDAKTASHRAVA